VIEQVGLLDEGYFMYCEEIDWALRIKRAGWKIHCVPAAEIVHYGGQSSRQIQATSFVNLWRSRHRLYQTHYSPLKKRLAAMIVMRAMDYRKRREESPELQAAYRQVAEIWSSV
jgi:GT2 family glycosyltransferase